VGFLQVTQTVTVSPENTEQIAKDIARKRYGGIAIKPVTTLEAGVAMAIFGKGGVGKTTLAVTVTDSEFGTPALILNCFGNPHVVSSYEDRIDVAEITEFNQANNILSEILKDPKCRYKTVIVDHVTSLIAKRLHELYGAVADVDWKMYRDTTQDVLQLTMNGLLLTAAPRKMNVIFLFQEASEERTVNGVKVNRAELAANKAIQEQFPGFIPFVGRLSVHGDIAPFHRLLDFTPVEKQHVAKIQRDPKHPLAGTIPMRIFKPSLAPILDTMHGKAPFPVDKHKETL
jgi:adenylate kinase family enzyme